MSDKKLCIDCKYFTLSKSKESKFARCAYPQILSLLDGEPRSFCEFVRMHNSKCGPEGNWFESKPPKKSLPEESLLKKSLIDKLKLWFKFYFGK